MTALAFELDDRRFDAWLSDVLESSGLAGIGEDVPLNIEIFVVAATDNAEMHSAPDALLLAWFVYLLGTSGCWHGPEGFGPKGISGHATRGPEEDGECLLLKVRHESGPAVAVGPLDLSLLTPEWHPSTIEQGQRWLRLTAEAVLKEASAVIGAALIASENPQTLVLDQSEIDELGNQPVGGDAPADYTEIDIASELKSHGVTSLHGKRVPWSIQAYASTKNSLNAELLDPIFWRNGPALPQGLIDGAVKLGFKEEAGMWVLRVPLDEENALETFVASVDAFIALAEDGLFPESG